MNKSVPERQPDELEYHLQKERRERIKLEQALMVTQAELEMERRRRRQLQRELLAREGRAARLLSPRRVVDYLRLLWWIVARPDVLKAYQADLDYLEAEALLRQASWLVSSLLWLPVLALFLVPWAAGELPVSPAGGLLLMGGIGIVWLLGGVMGQHDNALSALLAVFATTIITLCITAVVTFFVDAHVTLMLLLGGAVLLVIMTAVTVAKIINLSVASVVAHVVAVVIGGGVLIFMVDHVDRLLDAVALMLVAVIMVPLLEERYKNAI